MSEWQTVMLGVCSGQVTPGDPHSYAFETEMIQSHAGGGFVRVGAHLQSAQLALAFVLPAFAPRRYPMSLPN